MLASWEQPLAWQPMAAETVATTQSLRLQQLSIMVSAFIVSCVMFALMVTSNDQASTAAFVKPQPVMATPGTAVRPFAQSAPRPHVVSDAARSPYTSTAQTTGLDQHTLDPLAVQPAVGGSPAAAVHPFMSSVMFVSGVMGLFGLQYYRRQSLAMASGAGAMTAGHDESEPKDGIWRVTSIGLALLAAAGIFNWAYLMANPAVGLITVFVVGYLAVIFEHQLAMNKAPICLVMAVVLWFLRNAVMGPAAVHMELAEALGETAEILFFLLGAMSIVEIVDSHQGFKMITDNINTRSKSTMSWIIGVVTFWLSAVLDNLTSTIVMVSLLRKIVPNDIELRKLYGAIVVIAANAGGAWTPIGDVTTTMLWIGGQITTVPTMLSLFVPSVIAVTIPVLLMNATVPELKGDLPEAVKEETKVQADVPSDLVFWAGLACLIFVPVFKTLTGMPPYTGMLFGLGIMWFLTDVIHYGKPNRDKYKAPAALARIDTQGILFFLGILMSVNCLNAAGILGALASWLSVHLPSTSILAGAIGLASAVIDNVPLVAATMGMYTKVMMPVNCMFWQLVAFCAGTGGSCLIIGSAAGVAFMGMEKVDFGWYAKRISLYALLGYLGGMGAYFALRSVFVFV